MMDKEGLNELVELFNLGIFAFDELMNGLSTNDNHIYDRETLLDYAIFQIKHEQLFLAQHILGAVDNDWADYYYYDAGMGTLETPTAIKEIEDLYDYVD